VHKKSERPDSKLRGNLSGRPIQNEAKLDQTAVLQQDHSQDRMAKRVDSISNTGNNSHFQDGAEGIRVAKIGADSCQVGTDHLLDIGPTHAAGETVIKKLKSDICPEYTGRLKIEITFVISDPHSAGKRSEEKDVEGDCVTVKSNEIDMGKAQIKSVEPVRPVTRSTLDTQVVPQQKRRGHRQATKKKIKELQGLGKRSLNDRTPRQSRLLIFIWLYKYVMILWNMIRSIGSVTVKDTLFGYQTQAMCSLLHYVIKDLQALHDRIFQRTQSSQIEPGNTKQQSQRGSRYKEKNEARSLRQGIG